MSKTATRIETSGGWAIAPDIAALGEGMFRPVRAPLGITAFGMNIKVMQPGSESRSHWHTEQQEVIFVHAGEIDVTFGDGAARRLQTGAVALIQPNEPHHVRVASSEPAVLVMMGGKDGVVEGDAQFPPA